MRLTLRTLLAWLDDTLEPNQVREIGKQVSESPFAQELSERIHRVTRQRRLTVPSGSGPEGIDPNVVAGYLDNDLDPDAVAEFEKKCLTSDLNLSEVASVHQILSLLGQKVGVPPEARLRMYQLVKGRETGGRKRPVTRRPKSPRPVTTPIQPWVVPEAPKRPLIERFGPAVLCLALIGFCIFAAWISVTAPTHQPVNTPLVVTKEGGNAGKTVTEKPAAPASGPSSEKPKETAAAGPDAAQPAISTADAKVADTAKPAKPSAEAEAKPKVESVPAVPAGSIGIAEKSDGLFLRYDSEKREWERLTKETPLNRSDRLLCLTPFRATIAMRKARIALVGETEVRIAAVAGDATPELELLQGRLLVRQSDPSTLKVIFSNRTASLEMPPGSTVAIERFERRRYGQPITRTPPLQVCSIQGEVALSIEGKQAVLKPSNVAMIDGGGLDIATLETLPIWAAQSEPEPYELQVRDQFLKLFHPGRPILTEIVGAIEDDRPEIKQRAISALKALGDLSLLMPMLSRDRDPVARRATIEAIRSYMTLGPEAANRVRTQLDQEFGENLGATAQHMLIGYSTAEADRGEVYPQLVNLLSPGQPSVGIRELALDTLKHLTGRDGLGYDPDQPGGEGLDAWNDLLRRNELKAQAPRPTKAKNKGKS